MTRRGTGSTVAAALALAAFLVPLAASGQTVEPGPPPPPGETPLPPPPVVVASPPVVVASPPVILVQPPPPTPMVDPELEAQLAGARGLRLAGILTCSLGMGSVAVGGALAVAGLVGMGLSLVTLQWDHLDLWGSLYVGGVVLALAGSAGTVAGIPMWIIGSVRVRRLSRAMARVAPVLALDPASRSGYAGLVFRL